jgi:hypothetical protein
MSDLYRRLIKLELSLSPEQIVQLWLKNAQALGPFLDRRRRGPSPRTVVANSMSKAVQSSMKGYSDQEIERAILQARRRSDFLYMLIVDANVAVFHTTSERRREVQMIRYHLRSIHCAAKNIQSLEELRSAVLLFIEDVLIVEGALAQLSAEHFGGQAVLFSDTSVRLESQIDMATSVVTWFNLLARETGATELSLEELRKSFGPKVAKRVSEWADHSRLEMLSEFGEENIFLETFNRVVSKGQTQKARDISDQEPLGGLTAPAR